MREKVAAILENIRPDLRAEGGDVELIDVKDGVVSVKLIGGCIGCSMPAMALKYGIERTLKSELPEVKEVVRVQAVQLKEIELTPPVSHVYIG